MRPDSRAVLMRRLLAIALVPLLLAPLVSAHLDGPDVSRAASGGHAILMEQFTAPWCQVCATVDPWMPDFTADHSNRVVRVALHPNDHDPFGSPLRFLSPVIQAAAPRAVLEVSATDTAALTGSSRSARQRRYKARARGDAVADDTGQRILLAPIARNAAQHGRTIEPLLAIWDEHYLRISARIVH